MKSATLPVPKILLVDDSRDGLVVRKMLLEELGFSVVTASSGAEALHLFSPGAYGVVVTDYRMPEMNGDELILKIRRLEPEARIILLSGFVEPLGLTEQNTGANAVVAKNARETVHLVRWVKRLLNAPPPRKPAGKQTQSPPHARGNMAN